MGGNRSAAGAALQGLRRRREEVWWRCFLSSMSLLHFSFDNAASEKKILVRGNVVICGIRYLILPQNCRNTLQRWIKEARAAFSNYYSKIYLYLKNKMKNPAFAASATLILSSGKRKPLKTIQLPLKKQRKINSSPQHLVQGPQLLRLPPDWRGPDRDGRGRGPSRLHRGPLAPAPALTLHGLRARKGRWIFFKKNVT